MKKRFLSIAAVTLSASLIFSSCIGSFALSSKFLAWNKSIDNKFVNQVLFMVLSPAYAITLTADLLVLNSIEFWSGENPVEAGIIKTVQGEHGTYTVETLKNGYHIESEDGQEVDFVYNQKENTWSIVDNGNSTKLIQFVDSENAIVFLPNGQTQQVELSANGMLAFRQVMNSYYLASR